MVRINSQPGTAKVSPVQIQLRLGVMVCFGVVVAVGWILLCVVYSRLGYPRTPDWVRTVRLSDDVDSILSKLKVALDAGFEVTRYDPKHLILEKRFREPHCVMTFEVCREGAPSQRLSVRCPNHRWLNWSASSYRNWSW